MPATVERFEALMSVRRFAEADSCAREMIAQYPDWGAAYTYLARALIEQKRNNEALDAAKEGVRKAPHDAWAHAIVSLVYERLQRPSDAVASAREALRLLPTYGFAYCLLSYNYDRLQRYQDAFEATTAGLKHQPHDQELLRFHCFNLYRLNRFKESEEVARECLRLHPTSHEAIDVLGRIAMANAEKSLFRRVALHRVAHDYFTQALRLQPALEHIQLNARDNAVSCRRFVWTWVCWLPYMLLVGAATYLILGLVFGNWRLVGNEPMVIPLVGFFVAGAFVHFLVLENDPGFFLSLPMERLRIPSMPPRDEKDRPKFGNNWRVVVSIPPAVSVLLVLVVTLAR
jgi:tetratricopeptide (TPR) repeat protein